MSFYYQIELRNKSGTLLEHLENDVFSVSWSYATIGGCGDCEIGLRREFDDYGDIGIDYDVRIRRVEDPYLKTHGAARLGATLPMALAGDVGKRQLWWSGYVREIVPVFDEKEKVALRCSGYSRQMEYVIVPKQTYANQDVGAIARSIVNSYVLPGTQILFTVANSLMLNTNITVSTSGLVFDTSAWEALRTLAEIGGNAEVGVRADREIYFQPRSTAVKQTWVIGDRVKRYEPVPAGSADEIVHQVYLRGRSAFTATLVGTTAQTGYQKERVVFNPSISTSADASLYGTAFFSRHGAAQARARITIVADDRVIDDARIEDVGHPLGRFRVLGGATFVRAGGRLPLQLPGPLGTTLGATTDVTYRVNAIRYRPVDIGLEVDVDLGERGSGLSDLFRAVEFKLSELRQGV